MMPATCVPWPQSSYFVVLVVDEVDERGDALAGLLVALAPRSSCHGVMPESITATPMPAPV